MKIIKIIFNIFSKTNSKQKFLADLICYFNEDALLVKYKLNIKEGTLFDFYTTPSWFKNKNTNFVLRDKITNLLWPENKNKRQAPRPDENSKMLYKFNKEELELLNNFLNSNYEGTLKGLISLFKGNNPSGSYKNPNNSEIKSNNERFKNNLIMLLDILKINKKNSIVDINSDKYEIIELKEDQFNFFLSKTKIWQIIFSFIYEIENIKSKDLKNPAEKNKINLLEKEMKKMKNDFVNYSLEVLKDIRSKRNIARNIVDKLYLFSIEKYLSFEIAHIYPVSEIKNEIYSFIEKNKINNTLKDIFKMQEYKKILNKICDKNNLLKLEPNLHTEYDKYKFYWDSETGEVKYLTDDISNEVKNKLKSMNINLNKFPNIKNYLKNYEKFLFEKKY
ncbi:Uncharacterised protein [Mycoplasmopsis maculosa]|uniref:HNH nuclease domain-containing protein n=1 Tax=Mycoplasmopsis maculosa TaxID=114885 RepID=A0A449B4Q6_9BACT|nr:HNH endonuclease [Mycoplasmopsis maculosa]VEU75545.1 Uncharacterised protein [Mycoplasmopsis maculosa]